MKSYESVDYIFIVHPILLNVSGVVKRGEAAVRCALVSRGLQFRRSPLGSQCKDRFPLSRNFYMSTHVNCTRVNEIEAVYGRPRVHV